MTLEQLRIFVAVAEREHVTQAARQLNLTQSATSAAVAALEARYATRLFDRVGRRIILTEAGRLFLSEARAVLARSGAAELVLADLAGLKRGSLTLAASQTVGNYWLPQVIHRYRLLYPGIAIRLTVGNTETVAADVREGAADLGFVEGEIDDPALAVEAVAEDELVLVAAPAHPWAVRPWAQRSYRRIGGLEAMPLILREPGSGTRAIAETALRDLGVPASSIDTAFELPSNEAVRAAVEAGAGVTVISRLVAASSLKAGSLVTIDVELPKRRFWALRHRERYITQAEKVLHRLIAEQGAVAEQIFDPGL